MKTVEAAAGFTRITSAFGSSNFVWGICREVVLQVG